MMTRIKLSCFFINNSLPSEIVSPKSYDNFVKELERFVELLNTDRSFIRNIKKNS